MSPTHILLTHLPGSGNKFGSPATALPQHHMGVDTLRACSTSKRKLGCNAQLIVDEFGEKLLEELDYLQEARNIQVGLIRTYLNS